MRLSSFPPVVNAETRVLILGTMPGVRSLADHEYYAHPRNLFWPFMQELFGVPHHAPYEERLAGLLACRIGLWDVLKHCERDGSLDASIVKETEVPNDFPSLFRDFPNVRTVCFNGQKAAQSFRRHVVPQLPPDVVATLAHVQLPSTSPANAGQTWHEKLAAWGRIRE